MRTEYNTCRWCGKLYPKEHFIYKINDNIEVQNGQVQRVCHKCLGNKKE